MGFKLGEVDGSECVTSRANLFSAGYRNEDRSVEPVVRSEDREDVYKDNRGDANLNSGGSDGRYDDNLRFPTYNSKGALNNSSVIGYRVNLAA